MFAHIFMQANELLGRPAGRDGGSRQYEAGQRAQNGGHANGMTMKQEVEDEFEVRWSFVSISHVNILVLDATGWHA